MRIILNKGPDENSLVALNYETLVSYHVLKFTSSNLDNMHLTFNESTFTEFLQIETLNTLDQQFLEQLHQHDSAIHAKLLAYRHAQHTFTPPQVSELLLACAPVLEQFIAQLFNIETALAASRQATCMHTPIFEFKKWFVQRRARRRLSQTEAIESFTELDQWLTVNLSHYPASRDALPDRELAVAVLGKRYLAHPEQFAAEIEKLTRWCIRALTTPEGQAAVQGWSSFHVPQRVDHDNLVPITLLPNDPLGRLEGVPTNRRQRADFALTDTRMSARQVQDEVYYCIYCHDHDGDFCSKGFPAKKGDSKTDALRQDPLGNRLTGCPLDEKIAEMHLLKRDGYTIAALAMVMIDNPLCAATGHRICNDCLKACVYQKQEPVNIPQIETRVLTDVLRLPWGVEIYDLLMRWHPLRPRQWLSKPYNGLKILIAGQGPAGFTLAHHLLMEGFAVVGIDGLKIEPLPDSWLRQPVRDYHALEESLADRITLGFGGVAEYGITVRWDKNFLKLIYLSLARRPYFQVFGNVRFGGTVTVEDAWELGFDHVAIAVGAGLPQALSIPGSLAPGMRQAADFLMALQLTGAAKMSSLTNLQVSLPAIVIGGGLTAIDTATEIQAYYLVQIEKTLQRYEQLVAFFGETAVKAQLDVQSLEVLTEHLTHGRALRAERKRAQDTGVEADVQKLLRLWGGVTVIYRRSMRESPAYLRNHEEITKALEEGILYAEGLEPAAAQLDAYGHVQALVCQKRECDPQGHWHNTQEQVILPARAILVATGAKPNIAYEFEHRGHFQRDGSHYQPYDNKDGTMQALPVVEHCKISPFGPFTSYLGDRGQRVSFIGDTHPVFHGSVVKAIASGQRTYPYIVDILSQGLATATPADYPAFRAKMQDLFTTHVVSVQRFSPSVIEIQVRAPLAAKKFRPGHFFRVQNFETLAPVIGELTAPGQEGIAEGLTRLQTEATAMLGAKVDPVNGYISLMVLERGVSLRLYATLRVGEPIALMGPTGVNTKIPAGDETVMIVGGRLSAASIRSIGPAMRAAGNRVLYFAGFQTAAEAYCQTELEAAADVIVWVTERGSPITARRPQDCSATGDFFDILHRYAAGQLPQAIPLQEVTRVLIIGSNRLVHKMQEARQGELREYFTQSPPFIASIYSTMQCMLKGICAQCLQWQIDPVTKQRTKAVFACSWQDQPLDILDIANVDERLSQNRLQESLTNLWLDYLFAHYTIDKV